MGGGDEARQVLVVLVPPKEIDTVVRDPASRNCVACETCSVWYPIIYLSICLSIVPPSVEAPVGGVTSLAVLVGEQHGGRRRRLKEVEEVVVVEEVGEVVVEVVEEVVEVVARLGRLQRLGGRWPR